MTISRHQQGWVIVMSFVIAYVLTILPIPGWGVLLRPEWTLLTLIFWTLNLPQRIGVGIGWLVGLLLDVLTGDLLGQNALSFSIIAYLTAKLHQRIRLFPLWQQALTLLLLLMLHQLLILWIDGIIGILPATHYFWIQPISGALCWPVVAVCLQILQIKYRVR